MVEVKKFVNPVIYPSDFGEYLVYLKISIPTEA